MPANNAPDPAFGAAIRQLRAEIEISQEELADRAGLHVTSLREIELAKADPTLGTVRRLAAVFGRKPSEILLRAEQIEAERE